MGGWRDNALHFKWLTTIFAHRNRLHNVCYSCQMIFCVRVLSGGTGWWQYVLRLTRSSRVLLEKLTGPPLIKKFPSFYGTGRPIAFTSSIHFSMSYATVIRSMPPSHFIKNHFNIIHLRLGHPSGVSPCGLLTESMYAPVLWPIHVEHAYPIYFLSIWSLE